MEAVLTGDIINSRIVSGNKKWLDVLKSALKTIDKENWEVYRGDGFQLKTSPEEALLNAIYIKSCVKTIKGMDVRISIGLGKPGYSDEKVGHSNGEAFIFSGEGLENLKKDKINLAIRTSSSDFDQELNTLIRLSLTFMDSWGAATALIVKVALENSDLSQQELALKIDKTQSSVSEALKRAHFIELKELDALYRKKVSNLKS